MEVDGPLSAQEQMIILYDIKRQCQHNLSNTDTEATGKKKNKSKKLIMAGKLQHHIHQQHRFTSGKWEKSRSLPTHTAEP